MSTLPQATHLGADTNVFLETEKAGLITIRLFGDIFDQCYAAAREHVEAIGGFMVPPFDHADIIEGQATVAAEMAVLVLKAWRPC